MQDMTLLVLIFQFKRCTWLQLIILYIQLQSYVANAIIKSPAGFQRHAILVKTW